MRVCVCVRVRVGHHHTRESAMTNNTRSAATLLLPQNFDALQKAASIAISIQQDLSKDKGVSNRQCTESALIILLAFSLKHSLTFTCAAWTSADSVPFVDVCLEHSNHVRRRIGVIRASQQQRRSDTRHERYEPKPVKAHTHPPPLNFSWVPP